MLTLAHRAMLGAASRPKPPVNISLMAGAAASTDVGWGCANNGTDAWVVAGQTGSTVAAFVAKLDLSGGLLWQRKLSLTSTTIARAAAIDSSGAVYVVAHGMVTSGNICAYLVKYNASGVLQWQRKLSLSGVNVIGLALRLDSAGDPHILASVSSAKPTALLAKYSSGGALQWQREISHATNSLNVSPGTMDFDASGNIYFCLQHVITANSNTWNLVIKCSSSGSVSSVIAFRKDAQRNTPYSVVVDSSGSIYVGGTSAASGTSPFVCKFNSSGSLQWYRFFSGVDADFYGVTALAVSADGAHVYAGGGRYVLKILASDGSMVWQRSLTGSGTAQPGSQLVHKDGAIYKTGAIDSVPTTGSDVLAANLPDDGSGAATYGGLIVYGESTITSNVGSPSSATPTITDAAGSCTDAAGDMTDAAGSLTATPYL